MKTVFCWVGALWLAASAQTGHAIWERLGNPTVKVPVEHPPELGLRVDRLVFGPTRGECADEIVRRLVRDLVSHRLDVRDEAYLYSRLARTDFAHTGRVDTNAAMEMGHRLGPAVMVAVDVRRCEAETDFSTREAKARNADGAAPGNAQAAQTTYRLAAQGFLDLRLEMIDLTTGRALASRRLSRSGPEQEYSSQGDYPPVPSALDLLGGELDEAVGEARRIFLPWREEISVVYFDDGDCGLKKSYRALNRGDMHRAYDLSEQSLAACKAKPRVEDKLLARAYHNVGILRLLGGDHDGALDMLHTAADLRPRNGIYREGIAAARKAKESAAAMANLQWQTRPDFARQRQVARVQPSPAGSGAKTLRNADVMEMAQKGVPTSVILTVLSASRTDFDTSTPAIVQLAAAGVDREIIKAMLTAD